MYEVSQNVIGKQIAHTISLHTSFFARFLSANALD